MVEIMRINLGKVDRTGTADGKIIDARWGRPCMLMQLSCSSPLKVSRKLDDTGAKVTRR
jgi:hypothetical protein